MTGSPAIPVYIVPDADLEKNGGHIPVLGQPAIPITGLSGLQFYSGTSNPPTASPANVNVPATYYNTSTKFSWNWNIGTQAWIPVPKVYRALLTQSGTSAPVATVLENSLGGSVVWSRPFAGDWTAILSNGFPVDKTFLIANGDGSNAWSVGFTRISSNELRLQYLDYAGGSGGDGVSSLPVEILVYP